MSPSWLGGRTFALVLALGLLAVIVTGCPRPGPVPPTGDQPEGVSPKVLEKLKDAVVYIEQVMEFDDGSRADAGGSGVVITNNGRIATCAHVVDATVEDESGGVRVADRDRITVTFHRGTSEEKTYPAQILRFNSELDLALLKVDVETPTFLELADSDQVLETTRVLAVGFPLRMQEISFREGTVSAHRVYEGQKLVEHTVGIDQGNSGGPIVTLDGRVVGLNSWAVVSELMGTKFAVPANTLREWLASDPAQDPPRRKPGAAIAELLDAAGLKYRRAANGIFELPYEGDITVFVHKVGELMRLAIPVGDLEIGEAAMALQINYTDPLGRLAMDDEGKLFWEAQIPMSFVTPQYVKLAANAAVTQVGRWSDFRTGQEVEDPTYLYPGGDKQALMAKLEGVIKQTGLKYTAKDGYFEIPYEGDIDIKVSVWRGVALFSCWMGGMPGGNDDAAADDAAVAMLKRNYNDPLGRLSMDNDGDIVWEVQIPMDYLTPDYLDIVSQVGVAQAGTYLEQFGRIPFAGSSR